MNELVSIITPTFNSAQFISHTIQSVLNQTYSNWEMILVDDKSTDDTVSIINNFILKDSRIKLFQLKENKGAGIARSKGLELANGRYIAFLDADDLWKKEKLAVQIQFMKLNNLAFTFSFYELISEDGTKLNKLIESPEKLSFKKLYYCNYIGNLTGIYDSFVLGKVPVSSIRKRQDWIMWLEILKKIKMAYPVPESLAYYRVRENSISASKIDLIKFNYAVYKNYHQKNSFMATLQMIRFLWEQLVIKPRYIKQLKPEI